MSNWSPSGINHSLRLKPMWKYCTLKSNRCHWWDLPPRAPRTLFLAVSHIKKSVCGCHQSQTITHSSKPLNPPLLISGGHLRNDLSINTILRLVKCLTMCLPCDYWLTASGLLATVSSKAMFASVWHCFLFFLFNYVLAPDRKMAPVTNSNSLLQIQTSPHLCIHQMLRINSSVYDILLCVCERHWKKVIRSDSTISDYHICECSISQKCAGSDCVKVHMAHKTTQAIKLRPLPSFNMCA